jgi:hypothetical protein
MSNELEEIKIVRIANEGITTPSLDGSPGSGLYSIPFELSAFPPHEWSEYFVQTWNRPPTFTTSHRPGIASVHGKEIVLRGTTIEEVETTHKDTLQICVKEANRKYKALMFERKQTREKQDKVEEEHRKKVEEVSKRIKLD